MWALGLAAAASATTNPLLLGLIVAVASLVVAARRSNAPWAVGFRWYLLVAGIVVALRVVFRALTAGGGPTVLLRLPSIDLPEAAGVTLLGPVSAEALVAGFYDGLRLATIIVCVGAANALANSKRLLAAMPSALYEAGTVLVVAVSVFPQLVESVGRVHRARSVRGGPAGRRQLLRAIVVPVLTDALDRSLQLAASMDSRGYGRAPGTARGATAWFLVTGLLGIAGGAYGLLDPTTPAYLGFPMVALGIVAATVGFRIAGRRVQRSRYRPERWGAPEVVVLGCGIAAVAAVFGGDVAELHPAANPLGWPAVAVVPMLGILLAAVPAVAAPAVPVAAQT